MSIRLVPGFSDDVDVVDATEAALGEALAGLRGPARAALVYLSNAYEPSVVLPRLTARLGDLPLIGCTVSGLIVRGVHADDGVLVVLLEGEVQCAARLADLDTGGLAAVEQAAREACAAVPGARLVFAHPMATDLELGLIEAAQAGAGTALVVGGCSGDLSGAGTPRQFFGDRVLTRSMPLLAVAGAFSASCEMGCGWKPVGRGLRVTAVDGHVVTGLDNRPVFEVLSEYKKGEGVDTLTDTPFAVHPAPGEEAFFVRAVQRIEPGQGLRFLSRIPLGAELRSTVATVDEMMDGADRAAAAALERLGSPPEAGLLFSCTARKWRFGPSVGKEAARVAARLPGVPLLGIYVHGEVGPFVPGRSVLHNQTCAMVVLGGGG